MSFAQFYQAFKVGDFIFSPSTRWLKFTWKQTEVLTDYQDFKSQILQRSFQ